jgi:hypothetical protein
VTVDAGDAAQSAHRRDNGRRSSRP